MNVDAQIIPENIMRAAQKAFDDAMVLTNQADGDKVIVLAILAERERIVARLLEDLTPCGEDAMVTRSNAFLIKADFSYEEAKRLSDKEEA
ncbi:hypothetical protein KGO5_05650 [Sinorhizobium sp. KGO-5]|uniref:hypothetical protein n=1 Tax=Sinorhizobium sp. KGO-5 TaxID=1470810 RepID=UPI002949A1CD|nr:hypothetical protein KGO5_05650 [Sinorhizobium sp. KGO-5]